MDVLHSQVDRKNFLLLGFVICHVQYIGIVKTCHLVD